MRYNEGITTNRYVNMKQTAYLRLPQLCTSTYCLEPSTTMSFRGVWSTPSFNSLNSSSVKLCFKCDELLAFACFSSSTAQLYITIPAMAITIPMMFLNVSAESNSTQPKVRTHTVFIWPKTWKETAENRPMQRYWLILQKTAKEHERSKNNCTNGSTYSIHINIIQ